MTVKDLIEKLQQFDRQTKVVIIQSIKCQEYHDKQYFELEIVEVNTKVYKDKRVASLKVGEI